MSERANKKHKELHDLISKIERLKQVLANKQRQNYCPQQPFGPQKAFLELDCLEALLGGAASGGKSSCLLMAALQYVHVPGYAALILRKSYSDLSLPGALISRSQEWLSETDAHWNGIDKRWTFPSGATLSFGYMSSYADRFRYQGSELTCICIDELTQWNETDYSYLISRLRRLQGVNLPLRMRAATNPGGIGHAWVKRRFVDPETCGERVFIPSKFTDNPYVDQESYAKSLDALDSITRAQLKDGAWIEDSSGLVYRLNDDINLVDEVPKGNWSYILGMDFGIVDHTAFTVVGWREYDRTLYVCESFGGPGIIPAEAGRIAQGLEKKYHFSRIVGDTGGMGRAFAEEMRRRYHIPVEAADKQNKLGYISLTNGMLEQGLIKIHRTLCEPLIKEMRELPWHPSRTKEHPGFANHQNDSFLYSVRSAYSYLEGAEPPPSPTVGTAEYFDLQAKMMEESMQAQWEKKQREEIW